MEQTIIDFLARSSELILHNRLSPSQLSSGNILANTFSPNTSRFQLSFARKVDLASQHPLDWKFSVEKLVVIEFFVCSKITGERFLAEQWIFEITQGSHDRLNDTIDSSNTLYKKLSVLLRTISLLTVTLPLYQKVVRERGSSCSYSIEYSVNYSKDTLATWHPSVNENNDLAKHSSDDFVLPGRTFSFKVNYSKSLGFLQRNLEEEFEQVEAEENVTQLREANCIRRAFSDNHYNKDFRAMDMVLFGGDSLPTVNPFERGEDCLDSQIENMITRKRIHSVPNKKETVPRIWDMSKIFDTSKLKIKTLESESFGEGDIFLCENDEEKFTEVLSWKDISMRNPSPTRIIFQQKDNIDGSSGVPVLRKMSTEDFERNKMRMSIRPIEKIIEHTHDDKVAELLNSIEDLKALSKKQENCRPELWKMENKEVVEKGMRFESGFKEKREPGEEVLHPFEDMDELKQLYFQIKRIGSTK